MAPSGKTADDVVNADVNGLIVAHGHQQLPVVGTTWAAAERRTAAVNGEFNQNRPHLTGKNLRKLGIKYQKE